MHPNPASHFYLVRLLSHQHGTIGIGSLALRNREAKTEGQRVGAGERDHIAAPQLPFIQHHGGTPAVGPEKLKGYFVLGPVLDEILFQYARSSAVRHDQFAQQHAR
jgi:hypothetical protein